MDKLKAFAAFVKVVDTGGFTRASEALGMPKATVSTLVQDLEAELGTRLLHRSTRRVTLTADGAAYYERCVQVLDDVREADESVSSRQGAPSGRLRVDMTSAMARYLVREAVPEFLRRHPGIALELGCTDRPINLVSEGVDCVIRVGAIQDSALAARRIGSMRFLTCAAPSYLAAHGTPTHPQALHGHRWINYFDGSGVVGWDFVKDGERLALKFDGGLALNDSNVYEDACVAGLGVGQLPAFLVEWHERAGRLVPLLADWQVASLPVHAVYPSNRHLSTKVQAFVEWVAEVFEAMPAMRR